MLNHLALQLLADPSRCPPTLAQRALQLFADYDLSLPRSISPSELDTRWSWKPGTCSRVLDQLGPLGLIRQLTRRSRQSSGIITIVLAQEYCWTPRSLAAQWSRIESGQSRALAFSTSASPALSSLLLYNFEGQVP